MYSEIYSFRYMTFNVCNTPQMVKDPAYKELQFVDRLDKITAVIQKFSPDAVGLQEIRDVEGITVMSLLWEKLNPLGYRIKYQEGNSNESTYYNTIVYKADKLWPQAVTTWWNSATPEKPSCSYGNGWPRAIMAITFYPVKKSTLHRKGVNNEITDIEQLVPDYSSIPLILVNSHLGLARGISDPKERIFSNQNTIQKITQLVNNKPTFVVSLGDFNSFPESPYYKEEMNVYHLNGFVDSVTSSQLLNQDNIPISGTFIGYSPDDFKCTNEKLGAALDHIWVKSFFPNEDWTATIKNCFAITAIDHMLKKEEIKKESDLLMTKEGLPLRDHYPSDHLPVVLDFEVKIICNVN